MALVANMQNVRASRALDMAGAISAVFSKEAYFDLLGRTGISKGELAKIEMKAWQDDLREKVTSGSGNAWPSH